MKNIVVFASGAGTNAENIILHFKNSPIAQVVTVFCNKPDAKVLEKANRHQVHTVVFSKEEFQSTLFLEKLTIFQPDLIVLAGFLWKFPEQIIQAYPNKIINIHPALLPNYGGKGMYGMRVHQAVLENNDKETGITIHYVNENYDEGAIIFQKSVNIEDCTTAEEIANRIHELEHKYFPEVIEKLLT
jgi:phosphoribosylglycinamide formyltransferase-1